MEKTLFLVSGSAGRAQVLREAKINFQVLDHASEEAIDFHGLSPKDFVCKIALDKMDQIILPESLSKTVKTFLALSADTLVFTKDGQHLTKPKDTQDAKKMLKILSQGPVDVWTGCVLRKFQLISGQWKAKKTKVFSDLTKVFYSISESEFERYFAECPSYLKISSSAAIEGFGAQYTKWIRGNYSNVLGLPIFKLKTELKKFGFQGF